MTRSLAPLLVALVAGGLVAPAAGRQPPDQPAAGPTAEQLAGVVAECRKKLIFHRAEVNPFTNQLDHGFVVREPADALPGIPFPHVVRAGSATGLAAFDPSRPGAGVHFEGGARLADLGAKKVRATKSATFGSPASYAARDLDQLESAETLVGPFGDADLEVLKKLKTLKNLSTSGRVGPAGLKALGEFPALERLLLVGPRFDSKAADGFEHLKNLKALKQLAIHNHPGLPDGTLQVIAGLPALTHLELRGVKLLGPRNSFFFLEPARSLTSLGLAEVTPDGGGGPLDFTAFSSLAELHLEGRWVTDEWVQPVAELRNLHSVTLTKTDVSDRGLRALSRLPLRSLVISQNSVPAGRGLPFITGPGVAAVVKDLKSVTVLGLSGVLLFPPVPVNRGPGAFDRPGKFDPPAGEKPAPIPIDEVATRARKAETVAALKSLTALRCLNLAGTGITDDDADWIVELKSLEYLYLGSGLKPTDAAVAKIRAGLPKCTVARSPESANHFGKEPPK